MRALLARTAMLLIPANAGGGCGESGPNEPNEFTVEVTPATATLFTLAPGNTVTLLAVAKDQNGETIPVEFSSGNDGVATVDDDGVVTAAGTGMVEITASATVEGVTKSGVSTVTVQVAPAAAIVTAPHAGMTGEVRVH